MTRYMKIIGTLLSALLLRISLWYAIHEEYEKASFWMIFSLAVAHDL